MVLETSRFGELKVDAEQLIAFENGIIGFPQQREYVLIPTANGSGFFWLQSVCTPTVAFLICDPRLYLRGYQVPLQPEELQLAMKAPEKAQVFVIVNKVNDVLTGNFQGPLVINPQTRQGRQMVLSDKRYSTRHPLMRLPRLVALGMTA